jgi:hypothetical protein
MTYNRDGDGESGQNSGSPVVDATTDLPEMLSVLRHRTNRRILVHLLHRDEPVSVETLPVHLESENMSGATDAPPRTEGGKADNSRS